MSNVRRIPPARLTLVSDEPVIAEGAQAILDAEADRAQLAAVLLESVEPALVAARHAVGQAGGPAKLDEPVRAALDALRSAYRDLRAFALESGLRTALRELAAQVGGDRVADDRATLHVTLDADDPALDQLPPAVAVAVQRVAQAALRGARDRAVLRVVREPRRVKLRVESAEIACDASELGRWSRRASALGGDLRVEPGGVELSLPVELALPDQREGHHDDGLDL